MSRRSQVDLAVDEKADSPFPVRRSSRISSGQNVISSPAPKAIKSRRSSASSVTEKNSVEDNASPKEKRKTRRTSTEEDPKPSTTRSRRSSISRVIEEEKPTPNSPSRRSTRQSSSSPSLDVPARRTRRSSQDTETVDVPARRTTRRSSTGIQESTIEEIIEQAKPITRRRRSTSIDEQEETSKTDTRPKTKRLFNEDNHLEPIKEQDQEVKEKEVSEKSTHKLEVLHEISDEETEKIIGDLKDALEESSPEKIFPEKSITEVKVSIEKDTSDETAEKDETVKEKSSVLQNSNEMEKSIEKKSNLDIETLERAGKNEEKTFASPGSDKENTSVNIPKKRLSTNVIEENSSGIMSESNVFSVKTTSRNSFYEPMEVDDDEDDVFAAQSQAGESSVEKSTEDKATDEKDILSSKTPTQKILIINGKSYEDEEIGTEVIVPAKRASINKKSEETDDKIEVVTPSKNLTPKRTSMNAEEDNEIKDKVESPGILMPKSSNMSEDESEEISATLKIQTPKKGNLKTNEEDKERKNETTPPSQIFSPKRISIGEKSKEESKETEDEIAATSKPQTPKRISMSGKPSEDEQDATLSKIATPKRISMSGKPSEEEEDATLSKIATPKRISMSGKPSEEEEDATLSKIATPKRISMSGKTSEEKEEIETEDATLSKIATTKRISMGEKPIEEKEENETEDATLSKIATPKRTSINLKPSEEDEVMALSKSKSPKRTSLNKKHSEEDEEMEDSDPKNLSVNGNCNEQNEKEIVNLNDSISNKDASMNSTIKDDYTMEGSFSKLNSSDSDYPVLEKAISPTPEHSASLRENKTLSSDDLNETKNDDDAASDTSIKLVDTDDEDEVATKPDSAKDLVEIEKINVSVLDESFNSEEPSVIEDTSCKIVIEDSGDEVICTSKNYYSEEKIETMVVELNDEKEEEIKKSKDNYEKRQSLTKRKSVLEEEYDSTTNIPSIDDDNQITSTTNAESNMTSSKLEGSKDSECQISPNKRQSMDMCAETLDDEDKSVSEKSVENREIRSNQTMDKIEFILDTESSSDDILDTNDSCSPLSSVKHEKEAGDLESATIALNDTNESTNSIKVENRKVNEKSDTEFEDMEMSYSKNIPNTNRNSLDRKKNISHGSDRIEKQETNQTIVFQSVEVVQKNYGQELEDVSTSEDQKHTPKVEKSKSRKRKNRHSMPSSLDNNDQESDNEQVEEVINARLSLPSRQRYHINISIKDKTNERKKSIHEEENLINSRMSNTRSSLSKSISETESASEGKSNLIPDNENDAIDNDKLHPFSESEEVEEKTIATESNKQKTKSVSPTKESEEKGKRLRLSTELASNVQEQKASEKKKLKFKKDQLEIMARSGIEVEDDDLFDDLAEVKDALSDEESDENEIIVKGESVMSSCSDRCSSTDDYDLNDSFINDEEQEQELLSGEEDFLEVNKKGAKKYKRIIKTSTSDSDQEVDIEEFSNPSQIPEIKVVLVEEEKNEESIQNLDKDKAFEEKLDSILKTNPVDISTPNQTINEAMNTSVISESSVILQETCSIGAAKNKVIVNRINSMVDVFCKSINEPEGNISLNVSLNYIPPPTVTSVETINSLNIPREESSNNGQANTVVSPKKPEDKKYCEKISENTEISSIFKKEISKKTKKSKKKSKKELDAPTKEIAAAVSEQKKKKHKRTADCVTSVTNEITPVSSEQKKKTHKRLKECISSVSNNITAVDSELKKKTLKRPADCVTKDSDVKSHIKKNKKLKVSEESTQKASLDKGKVKKVAFETIVPDSKDKSKKSKNVAEPIIAKKKDKYDESVEAKKSSSSDIKKKVKTVKLVQEDTQQKKKEKRKHPETIEQDIVTKKSRISKTEDKKQYHTKNQHVKEIRPTIPSSRSVGQTEWDEELVLIQPSAATSSKSGFNLEKLIDRDFKNRMIYDTSRNKREPVSKSRKHH